MKTTALVTIFALLGASVDTVSAACYSTGEKWQDAGRARWHVERACKGYNDNRGRFQGYFAPGEYRSVCVQHSGTQKFEFQVGNNNKNAGFYLGDGDCVLRLQNLINGCSRGGRGSVHGWFFR
ncbi:hypothetical protein ACHAPT_004355 [Fusarium lateritium]